jgi:putative ABC transport system permease protein
LLIRTFAELYSVDPGFDPSHVLTMRTLMTGAKYQKTAGVTQAARDAIEQIRAIPGVLDASAGQFIPMQGQANLPFNIAGRAPVEGRYSGDAGWSPVAPGYFNVFKIPLRKGRIFTDRDEGQSAPVAIINEAMAKQFWKNGDPFKDQIIIGRGLIRDFNDEPRQIIGIVGDVHNRGLNVDTRPTVYVPESQLPDAILPQLGPISWVMRTQGSPLQLTQPVEQVLRRSTGLPVTDVRSMNEVISLSTARQRFNMLLMTVFGAMALLLAAIGIYGLMAYSVAQRTQEIGIRLALGAEPSQVRNMVVRQGMALAFTGVTLGLVAAWALARLLQTLLFGVKAHDPLVFFAVPLALALMTFIAVWLPANRAGRVSLAESLRYE